MMKKIGKALLTTGLVLVALSAAAELLLIIL